MRVSRAVNLGVVPAKKNEGWADDDTQVTVPPQERPILKEKAGSESSSEYEKVEHEDAVDS